jgi:inner membrane transporter RhtA
LLPAVATVMGVVVLRQVPTGPEVLGVALVVAGVAAHREGSREPPEVARQPHLVEDHL